MPLSAETPAPVRASTRIQENRRCSGACVKRRRAAVNGATGKRSLSHRHGFMSQPMQKQIIVLALTLFSSSVFVFSATDTPETRRREAERYLQVNPPKALFEDMADNMAANLPPDQRAQFKQLMTTQLDIAA